MEQVRHHHSLSSSGKGLAELSTRDVITTALFAVVVALALRTFILGAFSIPSHSMENTVLEGDYLLVSKVAFLFSDARRGDVVVFSLPDSLRGSNPDDLYIKRIVGVSGDSLLLSASGVFVNGVRLPDPPDAKHPTPPLLGLAVKPVSVVVPPNSYFVLGDNRSNSFDSRYWGCLPADRIVGAPMFVYWSYGIQHNTVERGVRWNRIFRWVR